MPIYEITIQLAVQLEADDDESAQTDAIDLLADALAANDDRLGADDPRDYDAARATLYQHVADLRMLGYNNTANLLENVSNVMKQLREDLIKARGDAQAAEEKYAALAESIPDGPADDALAAMAGVPPFTWRQRAEEAYEVVRQLESELADEDENTSDAQSYRQTGY